MADVQDLFVERVEGDSYLFEERVAAAARSCARRSRSRAAPSPIVLEVRETHHGPIVNEALGADEAEPLALSWQALREPTAFAGMFELLDDRLRAGAGRASSRATPRRPRT